MRKTTTIVWGRATSCSKKETYNLPPIFIIKLVDTCSVCSEDVSAWEYTQPGVPTSLSSLKFALRIAKRGLEKNGEPVCLDCRLDSFDVDNT